MLSAQRHFCYLTWPICSPKEAQRQSHKLKLTMLWANLADNILMIYCFFPQKIGFDISGKCLGDNLHEMSYSIFWEK